MSNVNAQIKYLIFLNDLRRNPRLCFLPHPVAGSFNRTWWPDIIARFEGTWICQSHGRLLHRNLLGIPDWASGVFVLVVENITVHWVLGCWRVFTVFSKKMFKGKLGFKILLHIPMSELSNTGLVEWNGNSVILTTSPVVTSVKKSTWKCIMKLFSCGTCV